MNAKMMRMCPWKIFQPCCIYSTDSFSMFVLRYILCFFCGAVGANLTYKFTCHVMLPRQFSAAEVRQNTKIIRAVGVTDSKSLVNMSLYVLRYTLKKAIKFNNELQQDILSYNS